MPTLRNAPRHKYQHYRPLHFLMQTGSYATALRSMGFVIGQQGHYAASCLNVIIQRSDV